MDEKKNQLDEYQEQKLLGIESRGMWLTFWGLIIAILYQIITSSGNPIGELIVFFCLDAYLLAGCLKNGIWSRRLRPNFRTNFIFSLCTGLFMGVLYFIISYIKYDKLYGSIATGIFMFISVFLLTWTTLTITAKIYKKRAATLENQIQEED